ncbi:MAG: hypothetical protein AB7H80_16150 [Candidatus Kapaibacterium sp.]
MRRSFFRSHIFLTLLLCSTLASFIAACSEETSDKDSSATTDVEAGPAEFRMTLDPALSLPAPAEALGKDTIIVHSPEGEPALYGIESARIIFEMKGDRTGRIEHIFKDYGRYERKVDSTMPLKDVGSNYPNHTLAITTPEITGNYDYLTNYGWQMPMRYQFPADSAAAKNLSIGEFEMLKLGGKKIGDTVINGYQTRMYRMDNPTIIQTFWVWRGIPIRVHMFLPLDNLEFRFEPVKIELNPTLSDDTFAFEKWMKIEKRESAPLPGPRPIPQTAPEPENSSKGK